MLPLVLSNSPAPANEITTLTYRGITYQVFKNRTYSLGYAPESFTTLMREKLVYRGVQYKQASIYEKAYTSNASRRLSYRGVIYEVIAKY